MSRSECGCGCRGGEAPAREVSLLKERFVRGETDKAEFEEKRQVISEPRGEARAAKEACC